MSTFIVGALLFGFCGYIVYKRVVKGSGCEDCKASCAMHDLEKKEQLPHSK